MSITNEHIDLTNIPPSSPPAVPTETENEDTSTPSSPSSPSPTQGAETANSSTSRIFFKKTSGETMTGHTPTKREITAFMQKRLEVMEKRTSNHRTRLRQNARTPTVTPRKRRRVERSESPLFVTPGKSPAIPSSSTVRRNDDLSDDNNGDDDDDDDDDEDCIAIQHNVIINDSLSKRDVPWTDEPKARNGHCSMADCKEVRGPTIKCSGGCHRKAHAKCIAARTIVGRNNQWTCRTCRIRMAREKAKKI